MTQQQEIRFEPAYLALLRSGELRKRVEQAWQHLEDSDLCARYCRVNRIRGVKGAVCRTAEYPPLDQPLSAAEFQQALNMPERFGLWRLDQRSHLTDFHSMH